MDEDDHAREASPCIWVSAGVLNYRLCDKAYDCERCELYHALCQGNPRSLGGTKLAPRDVGRGGARREPRLEESVNAYVSQFLVGCRIHLDRLYGLGHVWVLENTSGASVGLTPFALRVLHPIDEVITVGAGAGIRCDEACAWVRRGKLAVPLIAPLSGEVNEVNGGFARAAREASQGDVGELWIFRVTPAAGMPPPEGYRGEATLVWFLEQIEELKGALREALNEDSAVGATLHDGGAITLNLERVLGRPRFEALAERLLRVQV